MITLTNPKVVNNVLGGTSTVSYDKLVFTNLNYDVISKRITGTVRLTCTADAAQTPLFGSFQILPQVSPAIAQVDIPDLPFHRIVNLDGGAQTTVNGWITTVQAQIESGFVAIGEIAGVQSAGV